MGRLGCSRKKSGGGAKYRVRVERDWWGVWSLGSISSTPGEHCIEYSRGELGNDVRGGARYMSSSVTVLPKTMRPVKVAMKVDLLILNTLRCPAVEQVAGCKYEGAMGIQARGCVGAVKRMCWIDSGWGLPSRNQHRSHRPLFIFVGHRTPVGRAPIWVRYMESTNWGGMFVV